MPKVGKYLLWGLGAAVAIFLVWRFSNIVAYILISAVLAIIGKPIVDALQHLRIAKVRMPKWLAALLTLGMMWAVALLFFSLFIPMIFGKLGELLNQDFHAIFVSLQGPLNAAQEWIVETFSISDPEFSLTDQLAGVLNDALGLDRLTSFVSKTVLTLIDTGIALFSITFITFFFLKRENMFRTMVVSLFPQRYEDNIIHAIDSATNLLMRYFTGILAESTIIFILLSSSFMLWGFTAETAFFMGFVVGIMNVIPYVGPIISGCICVLVGVLSPMAGYSPMEMIMVVLSMILLIQGVDNFVLQPYLYSNRVKAHPLEIFLVILIAGSLGGVIGMLIAIPSYTVLRVFAKEFLNRFRVVRALTDKMD